MSWGFLIDENLKPRIAELLGNEGIRAEHVQDALWKGADDHDDIVPYARENDLIIVTNNIEDFATLDIDDHAGIAELSNPRRTAYDIAMGILAMVENYEDDGGFDSFYYDTVDAYLPPA